MFRRMTAKDQIIMKKKIIYCASLSFNILSCLMIVNVGEIFNIDQWNLLSYKNVNFEAQIFIAMTEFEC